MAQKCPNKEGRKVQWKLHLHASPRGTHRSSQQDHRDLRYFSVYFSSVILSPTYSNNNAWLNLTKSAVPTTTATSAE
jgi:hypothetical protein